MNSLGKLMVVGMAGFALGAQAYEATIEAPNGVGDVVALTNALTELNAVLASEGGKIWLEPGVYDLRGTYMMDKSHLYIVHTGASKSLLFAGKGAKPGDTVLIGGGETEKHRVIQAGGGGNSGWATFSNLTVTCGYVEGEGGGGIKANHSSRYIDMIITNNYAGGSGGGCYGGQAYRCLFANNRAGTGGSQTAGAFFAADNSGKCGQKALQVSGAWDCVFTNNTLNGSSGGGAIQLRGICQRCTFHDNSVTGNGGGGIKIVESYVDAPGGTRVDTLVSDCTFVRNTGRYGGAIHGTGCIVSNCTFIANKEDCTWGSDGGGALCASSSATILDCVFEGNGGTYSPGGAIRLKAGGIISGCSFVTNSTPTSGGAIHATAGAAISDCVFTNNTATSYGGALYVPGGVTNCTFVGNLAIEGGGAVYANALSDAGFVGCLFVSNHLTTTKWAHGGAVRGAGGVRPQMRDCTFTGNDAYGYGAAAYYSDLYGCVVTNHVVVYPILYGCNMTGCNVGYNTISGNAHAIDYAETAAPCTNINCLIISNSHPAIGHVSMNKVNINCTYIGNVIGNINYGDIIQSCPSYNCLFAGNKVGAYYRDIKTWYQDGDIRSLALTNCLFNVADVADDYEGMYNCKQVADLKFEDAANGNYTPKYRSAAYNAGCSEPWILELVGDKDLTGNPRVFGDGLDVGAYECQRFPPGAVFTVR